ncbi:hypothetical protein ZIOFF_074084 [Zingiber officinale]|uniref:Uncharacterized protein n=1 Tax=Zingiber officinale TaxID=94328 RepID=A0A8J5CTW1_ZINOF|nr:hypothetical protein ZIOFF_074084 [Zingiber officinale]
MICNLAIVVAAVDGCGGLLPVLKACFLVRGHALTALTLALPANIGMAAVEALFQYRVIRQYNISGELSSSLLWEAISIVYFYSLLLYHCSILPTHLFNSFVILSANATVLAFLFLAFNAANALSVASNSALLLSAAGTVLYSVVIANATVICNLAIVVDAVDGCGGLLPVLKACFLVRGHASTALTLALPANLGMAAVEDLFQYRVIQQYNISGELSSSLLWEAISIVYLYALLLVLEVIMNCKFCLCELRGQKATEEHGSCEGPNRGRKSHVYRTE